MQIGNVKVGLSQTNIPAPLNYRKFLNFLYGIFVPATTTFLFAIPMPANIRSYIIAGLVYVGGLAKGWGMITGNGQTYTPTNEQVEKKQSDAIKFIFWFITINIFFNL